MSLLSYFSWGALIRHLSRISLVGAAQGMFDLAFGTLSIFFFSYALTLVGLFQSSRPVFAWMILAMGFALGLPHLQPRTWLKIPGDWLGRIFFLLPLMVILLRLIESLQFNSHGDAYYVYLPAPRAWATTGGFTGFTDFSSYFFSSTWESLYSMGTVLMGLQGGNGLDLGQWYCQWVTSGIALPGILLALTAGAEMLEKDLPVGRQWWSLSILYAMQISCLRWTANLAKNDMGIVFWGVSSWCMLNLSANASAAFSFLTGALIGATAIGKLNTAIFAMVLTFAFFILNPKRIVPLIAGGLFAVTPVILRNLIHTGNPVFPWLSGFFGTLDLLGLVDATGSSAITRLNISATVLTHYFKELFFENPLVVMLIPYLFFRREGSKWLTFVLPLISLFLYSVSLGPSTEIRLQGPSLMLVSFLAIHSTFQWFSMVPGSPLGEWIPALFVLGTSNISFFTLAQLGSPKFGIWRNRIEHLGESGGPAKIWIRENLPPSASILTIGDGYHYYLMDYNIRSVGRERAIETPLVNRKAELVIKALNGASQDFLYITDNTDFLANRETDARIIEILKKTDPKCHAFDSPHAHVWDLKCLQKSIH